MKKIIFLTFLIFVSGFFSLAQKSNWKAGKSFPKAKVYLVSGEVIKTNKLSILSSEIKVIQEDLLPKSYNLNEVKQIDAPTKDWALAGLICGTGGGFGLMLIIKTFHERLIVEPGYYHPEITINKMPIYEQISYVLGGAAIGAIIGSAFKTGWKKIYPNDNLSFNISIQSYKSIDPVFSVSLNF